MAGVDQSQYAILVHDEITAKLGCIIAVRVVERAALEPTLDVNPYDEPVKKMKLTGFQKGMCK